MDNLKCCNAEIEESEPLKPIYCKLTKLNCVCSWSSGLKPFILMQNCMLCPGYKANET